MNKRNWFFGEVLDEANMDAAFANVENEIRKRALDVRTPGILSGCHFYEYAFDNNAFSVTPGVLIGTNGERIQLRDAGLDTLGGFISADYAGVSTSPGSGNYRWVTVAVRFGRTMLAPETDDLSNTVYTSLTDSWNTNGEDFMADATQALNVAGDGGSQIDNASLSLASFYVVGGPVVPIGDPLSYPALPADAIILADVLYTDGDEGLPLDKFNISYRRQTYSHEVSTSAMGFPADTDLTFVRRLLWEIECQTYKIRFYASSLGLEITANASWNQDTGKWTADDVFTATRVRIGNDGFIIEMKNAAAAGTPWFNTSQSTAGWDSFHRINTSTLSSIGFTDLNGNSVGNGVQLGYIALALAVGNVGTPSRTAIQFPRAFNGAPSSVTFGAGISESNVSSVAATNLTAYGCTFGVANSSSSAFLAQRIYTATQ